MFALERWLEKKEFEGNCRYTMYLKTDFGLLKDLNVASILTRREETEAADPASNRLDTDSATWAKVYVARRACPVFCSATIMSFQLHKRSTTFVQCFFLLLFLWGWATWLCVCRKPTWLWGSVRTSLGAEEAFDWVPKNWNYDVSLIPNQVPTSGASTRFQKHIALHSAVSLN